MTLPFGDPNTAFKGRILIVAPHMDDEALACGGLIARISNKERIFILYATDGTRSPSPIIPGLDSITTELGKIRENESLTAMKYLGIPEKNINFLGLPEANLRKYLSKLQKLLLEVIQVINPDFIFIPFRYDRHPDHLSVNHVLSLAQKNGLFKSQLIEYFVYYRWRLLPQGDIRKYIRAENLVYIDISDVSQLKRTALNFYKSQTTKYFSWQTRPILTPKLIDEECNHPELFLLLNQSQPGTDIFTRLKLWITLAHRIEPYLQKWKYLASAYIKRGFQRGVHLAG